MSIRISFYTLGCRLNQAETAALENSFEQEGFRVVDFKEPADIVVVNTCTVTEHSDTDTRRLVNKINRLNPKSRIALIGCQAQTQKKELIKLPHVFWVVGNSKKMELPGILKDSCLTDPPAVITPRIFRGSFTMPLSHLDRRHTRANLKIQDGCDSFCSFCEIPYARGRARSRKFEDILLEANAMAQAGHKEVVLTGINLGAYQEQNKTLIDVIDALEKIEGILRVRISSIEPTSIPEGLIERMNGTTKLCRYLHVPLQSGCNKILRLMNRQYKKESMSELIDRIYKSVPHICLGTDIMVGFPGETREDFEETRIFLRDLPISYFHVFSYSKRRLAKSRTMPGPVPQKEIGERSETLRQLSVRKRKVFYETLRGSSCSVLFEQKKGDFCFGLTDNYVKVGVKSSHILRNEIYSVLLKEIEKTYLCGDIQLSKMNLNSTS